MTRSEYDEQSKFISNKVLEIAREEFKVAVQTGTLTGIDEASIEDLLKVLYAYYSELNRCYSGGFISADINDIIEAVMLEYIRAKESPELFRNFSSSFSDIPLEKKVLITECHENFENSILDLNFDYTKEGLIPKILIKNPIYHFENLGNSGAFSILKKDKNDILTRITYFGKNGEILDSPTFSYFYFDSWHDEYPPYIEYSRPSEMPFSSDRIAKAIERIDCNELITDKQSENMINEFQTRGE